MEDSQGDGEAGRVDRAEKAVEKDEYGTENGNGNAEWYRHPFDHRERVPRASSLAGDELRAFRIPVPVLCSVFVLFWDA
jgi:hypothetical protein